MVQREAPAGDMDDVDVVTRAVLTASRLLVAVSARSLAEVEERVVGAGGHERLLATLERLEAAIGTGIPAETAR